MLQILAMMAPVAGAGPEDPRSGFQQWLLDAAKAGEWSIVQWGSADLDRDGRVDESYAGVCRVTPQGLRGAIVIGDERGNRWVVERANPCEAKPTTQTPEWETSEDQTIVVHHGGKDRYELGLVDGSVEVVRRYLADEGSFTSSWRTDDWIARSRSARWEGFVGSGQSESALVIVEGRDPAIDVQASLGRASTVNRVLSGETSWTSRADAALSVVATQPDDEHVRVVVRVTDDRRVAAPSAEDLPDADHLELWWCGFGVPCDQEEAWNPLLVGWSPSGSPVASWGKATDAPLPPLTRVGDSEVGVLLPLGSVVGPKRDPGTGWGTPFSVVFADSDREGRGVETRVGTSDLIIGDGRSLGSLERYPGYRTFPTLTERVRRGLRLEALRQVQDGSPR